MEPTPPVQCATCCRRAECEKRECPCPELEAWLDETYRDHYSVDTPEEHRLPVEPTLQDDIAEVIARMKKDIPPSEMVGRVFVWEGQSYQVVRIWTGERTSIIAIPIVTEG